jgi:hypothetical protein
MIRGVAIGDPWVVARFGLEIGIAFMVTTRRRKRRALGNRKANIPQTLVMAKFRRRTAVSFAEEVLH